MSFTQPQRRMDEPLVSDRRLARNIAWNLTGAAVPLFAAAWAIPRLVARLGPERFGLLALIWAGVGYFSLFDLGFGRALTKLVAQRLGEGRSSDIGALVRTALTALGVIGATGGVCIAGLAPWIVRHVLSVPPALRQEATTSFAIAALTLPVVVSAAGVIGVLQAYQRFGSLAVVQTLLGIATFLAPFAALQVHRSLVAVTLVLSFARVAALAVYLRICGEVIPAQTSSVGSSWAVLGELFRFGGWVTVSNVLGPIMVYLDRFLIAALVTIAAVAYYTTPYEMVTRLWVLADGLIAVVFPAVAVSLASAGAPTHTLYTKALRVMSVMMIVPVGLVVLFAGELLTLWLGREFASASSAVLRWQALGVFANALARLPFAAVQASGRPDITAKLHLLELPLYLCALWFLVRQFGIQGAAVAWTFRILFDAALLFWCGFHFVREIRPAALQVTGLAAGSFVVLGLLVSVHSYFARALGAVMLVLTALIFLAFEIRAVATRRDPLTAA